MGKNTESEHQYSFPEKIWITGGIFALIAVILLLIKATFSVLLLIIAGTLIAVYFRGLGDFIEKKIACPSWGAMLISVFGSLIILALMFWLIGAEVQSQITQLIDTFPSVIQQAKEQIKSSSIGERLLEYFSSENAQLRLKSIASTFLSTTFGFLGDIYVILIAGIYLTVAPHLYKKGIVKLIPVSGRKKANKTLSKLGHSLKQWLKGKLLSMLITFILIAIGLKIIGLPMWLALAIITALLNFIPNFGPIIAAIPAVLIGLTISPTTALVVAGLFLVAQTLEGTLITPQIQQKMVHIPPALLIVSQVIIAAVTGFWGLVFAAPLLVIIIVLVKELYIKEIENKSEV